MNRILFLPRPLGICGMIIVLLFSGCNKEVTETDARLLQAGASSTFSSDITEIAFGYSGAGMLVTGNRRKVYKTSNYGVTWAVCTTFTTSSSFIDQLRYTNTGTLPYFVYHSYTSANAQLFTNITGGNTWYDQITSNGTIICHSFYNSSSGYAYIKLPSFSYALAQTTDFGDSYTYVCPAPVIGPFLQFTSATRGYAITDQNDFSFTDNGGLSWTATHPSCKYCTKVSPNGTCFLIGLDEKIYKSTDFGESWNLCFDDPGGNYYTTIDHSDNGLVVVSAMGQLLCSRDAGTTWKYLQFEDPSLTLSKILVLGDGSVIGTSAGTVSKYIIPETL
jgi:photosystem II stability/assembly factor-like uncharacterized protein